MAQSKILSSWKFLVLLTDLALFVQGCGLSPGLQVKAGPSRFFESTRLTEPVEEDDYILIPVTSQLIDRLELQSSAVKRDVPPEEWGGGSAEYKYHVGPQDLLQVVVWDHSELSIT
ncbi:MAG: hypothetical protein ACRESZ_12070, partial [Methylococcales bacterium]